jgi:hypothetical protein
VGVNREWPGAPGLGGSMIAAIVAVLSVTKGLEVRKFRQPLALLLVLLFLLVPKSAQAADCNGGWFCEVFGITTRTEIRRESAERVEQINAAKEEEIARIEAQAQIQAAAEQTRLQEMVTRGEIAKADAEAKWREYEALIGAWKEGQIRSIELEHGTVDNVITQQTKLGLAAVDAAEGLEEDRIFWRGLVRVIVVGGGMVAIAAVVIAVVLSRRPKPRPQPMFIPVPMYPMIGQQPTYPHQGQNAIQPHSYSVQEWHVEQE